MEKMIYFGDTAAAFAVPGDRPMRQPRADMDAFFAWFLLITLLGHVYATFARGSKVLALLVPEKLTIHLHILLPKTGCFLHRCLPLSGEKSCVGYTAVLRLRIFPEQSDGIS